MEINVLKILNKRGLHARAAAKFVKLVAMFDVTVTVSKDNQKVTGDSILGLMMLAAMKGDLIKVRILGPDARAAIRAITQLVENKFDEE